MEYWSLLMLDGAVIGGSFLFFLVLSRTVLLFRQRSVAQTKSTEDVENSGTDRGLSNGKRRSLHAQDNRSFKYQNSSAEIPGLLLVSVGSIVVVIAALITTDILRHPLSTDGGQSPLTRYALLSAVGHHAYRLLACACFGASRDRVTSLVSHTVALLAYSTVAFTREDTMLGISGLVYQAPFILFVSQSRRQCQWLSLVAAFVFLQVLPTLTTGYSLFKESIPEALSLWSTCVLFLSLVYFGLLGIWILAVHIRRLQRCVTVDSYGATQIEPAADEKTKLLEAKTVKVIGRGQGLQEKN